MKIKIILLSLLSCLMLFITACSAAVADEEVLPELKYGKYHLYGDESTGVFIELTENTVRLGGDNLRSFLEEDYRLSVPEITDEETIKKQCDEEYARYSIATPYNLARIRLIEIGDIKEPYGIFFSVYGNKIDENTNSGECYIYDYKKGELSFGEQGYYFKLTE
ncbi:MAG: hypothetical protein IJZ51_09995 [Ruminiclostridium sp.]|nr:hypothetical protein [Ruminiclostridium sp.]